MRPVERCAKAIVVFFAMFVLVACTTTVYKDDVKKFADGVENATVSFDKLRDASLEIDRTDRTDDLRNACTLKCPAGASKCEQSVKKVSCPALALTAACEQLVEKVRTTKACSADWVLFRDGTGSKPSCQEQKFYTLPAEDAKNCKIGIGIIKEINGEESVEATELDKFDLQKPSANTAKMANALLAYATALGAIVSSENVDELTKSVAELRGEFEGLAATVAKESGKKEQKALGPIAELLGFALINVLETKRFNAMKSIVDEANPLVTEAAEILSRNSLPLSLNATIEPESDHMTTALDNMDGDGLTMENYADRLLALETAKSAFVNSFAADTSAVYKSMAKAHTALKEELNDPKTQLAHATQAVNEFYKKSIVVREALAEQKKSTSKDSSTTSAK